jgi:signal transduction histidine kinase
MAQTTDLGRGAALTLTEAAEACGVSRSTIKSRLPEFANADQDASGSWRVPVSDLLGAGLKLRPRPATQASQSVTQGHDPGQSGADLAQARARIEQLTADLAAERTARQVAEAKVALMAQNLDDLRFSLRAISGPPQGAEATAATAPAAPSSVQVPAAAAVPAEPQPRRGLWARLRGG